MDLRPLLGACALPPPSTLRPAGGTNNRSAHVETPAGAYVLRAYQNMADPRRVPYEHAVLCTLQWERLPFAVPCPMATPTGATVVPIAPLAVGAAGAGGGPPALVALFPRLPGVPPD